MSQSAALLPTEATSVASLSDNIPKAFKIPPLDEVAAALVSQETDIVTRMKSLFYARHHGGVPAVEALIPGLSHPSILCRHEIAYVLGQLGELAAIDTLRSLLRDDSQHDIVRHEAAEGIAALGQHEDLPLLEEFAKSSRPLIQETCQIAVVSLKKKHAIKADSITLPATVSTEVSSATAASTSEGRADAPFYLYNCSHTTAATGTASEKGATIPLPKFTTVDPIAPTDVAEQSDIGSLRLGLIDQSNPLHQRYQSLFALRNLTNATGEPTKENEASALATSALAADAIIDALATDKASALLRHEVAFVLGQIQIPKSIRQLLKSVQDPEEHAIVRHEAALALGSVVASTTNSEMGDEMSSLKNKASEVLKMLSSTADTIVAESCLVALDNINLKL